MKSIKNGQKVKSKILIALLCFLMVASVVPAVVLMSAPKAEAVAVGNFDSFKSNLEAGNSVELTASFSGNSAVNVKPGSNVTINLGNHTVSWTQKVDINYTSLGDPSPFSVAAAMDKITNYGHYALSIPANTTVNITGGTGKIYRESKSDGSSSDNADTWYSHVRAVYNAGTLNINSGTIHAHSEYVWKGGGHGCTSIAIGVYNNGGTVNMNGGRIEVKSDSRATSYKAFLGSNRGGNGFTYGVGIYSPSGTVNVRGGTIDTYCLANTATYGVSPTGGIYSVNALAIGVDLQGSGNCYVDGGTIDIESEINCGTTRFTGNHCNFAHGISTTNNHPSIVGLAANINTNSKRSGSNGNYNDTTRYAVSLRPTSYGHNSNTYFIDDYGAGQQTGNILKNSWVPNEKKVLHYYRFFKGKDASTGYDQVSFKEATSWMKDRMNGDIDFNNPNGAHFASSVSYAPTADFGSKNENYYSAFDVSYVTYSLLDNAPNVNHNTKGTVMGTSISHSVAGAGSVTIVYYNFYKNDPTQLTSCEATNTNFPFLNREVIAGEDFGLKLYSGPTGSGRVDESAKFNITGSETGRIPVTYRYKIAGGADFYTSGLPTNVGVYDIQVSVSNDVVYSPSSKNVASYTGSFQIEIQKLIPSVEINIGSLIYGNSLSSLGSLTANEAGAIGTATVIPPGGGRPIPVAGTFAWNVDSSQAYPGEASATGYLHTVTFTPTDAVNVESVVKEATVSVTKRPLTISANQINTHTYGDDVASSYANNHGMNVTITGAAPHENPSSWLADITYVMDIDGDGIYGQEDFFTFSDPENPDAGLKEWWRRFETDAGTYSYMASDDVNEHVNRNYAITCTSADFVVAKRDLTAYATPIGRSYEPGNTSVDVSFEITSGKPVGDNHADSQLALSVVGGQIPNDSAGSHLVTISAQPVALTRRLGQMVENTNYTINITNFDSSFVEIGKAQPIVVAPVFSESMIYDTAITLGTLEPQLLNNPSNIGGYWKWVYDTSTTSATIPQVGNGGFYAKFFPDASNSVNYTEGESQLVQVPITKRALSIKPLIYDENDNEISDWTLIYGDAKPRVEIFYDGFAGGENENNVTNASNGGSLANALSASTNYERYLNASDSAYSVVISGSPTAINYDITIESEKNLKVLKKNLVVKPIITWTELTYGDPLPNLTNLTYSYTGLAREQDRQEINTSVAYSTSDYLAGSDVATNHYYVVAGGMTSANYEIEYQNVYFDVVPKSLRIMAKPITIEYGDDLPTDFSDHFEFNLGDFVLGHHNNPSSVISGQANITCPTYEKWSPVGQYPIQINTGGLSAVNGNYAFEAVDTDVYLIVIKASITIITPPTVEVDVTKPLAEGTIEGGEVYANVKEGPSNIPGSWEFVDPSTIPPFESQAIDTYEMYFVPLSEYQDRYDNSPIFSIHVEVLPIQISGEVGIYGSPMAGQTLSVVADALVPNDIYEYTCQWFATDEYGVRTEIAGATGYAFEVPEELIDSRIDVQVTVRPGTAFAGSRTSALTEPVSAIKTLPTSANFEMTANGGEYNGGTYSAQFQAVDLDGDLGNVTVKYNNSTDLPVKAGVYRVTLDISASDYYGPVVGLYLGDLEITPRSLDYYIGINNKTYDSTNTAALTGANVVSNLLAEDEGKVTIITSTIRASFVSPNATEDAVLSFTGGLLIGEAASNYKLVLKRQVAPVEIAKAKITADAMVLDREYSPDDYTADVEFINVRGVYYADTGVTPLPGFGTIEDNIVGTHPVTVVEENFSLNGGEAARNYYLSINNKGGLFITISKATPDVVAPSFAPAEYEGLKVSEQFPLEGNWEWLNPDELVTPSKALYDLVYDLEDSNYNTLELQAFIEITPANLEIKVHDQTITYGQHRPASFDISYEGFKGSDNENTAVHGVVGFFLEYERGADVGTYPVALNDTLYSENYELNLIPGELEVLPKDVYTTFSVLDRTYTPGDYTVQLTASDLEGKEFVYDTVYISNSRPLGYIESDNAGENIEITHFNEIELIGGKSHNYNLVITNADSLTVNIAKARPSSYLFPSIGRLEYGEPLAAAVFEGHSGDGNFAYEDGAIVPPSLGLFEYEAVFVPTDPNNYEVLTSPVRLEVVPAQVTEKIQLGISGNMIIGETLRANISGLGSEALSQAVITWTRLDSPYSDMGLIVSDALDYTLTEDDVGKYLMLEISLSGNFEGYKLVRTPISVSQPIISFWQKLIAWINSILLAFQSLGF